MTQEKIRQQLARLIKRYYAYERREKTFVPGKTRVRYSGGYFGHQEIVAMMDSLLNGWLGMNIIGEKFEKKLAEYLNTYKTLVTNSGSSSSLLAISSLTSRLRPYPLKAGDEVITPACTFATTVSAIVRNNLVPKFIDVDINTLNPTIAMVEKAMSRKTKALFLAHTLGNPNEMDRILMLAKKYNLYVIEDNCDGLGSIYKGKKTGTFGHLGTLSFYPAHHMTLAGEGGAVIVNDPDFYKIALTLRNWGRGCWCLPSEKNPLGACKNRFNYTLEGDIPVDQRYYFSELGYNLKPVEVQVAMGIVQLRRFPMMAKKRRDNFSALEKFFNGWEKFFYLPKSLPKADPCWFAFPLTVREKAPFTRNQILAHLENHQIEGRSLFAGNIVRHPALRGVDYKVSGNLKNSDNILKNSFFVGVWPGIGSKERTYMQDVFENFLVKY